MGGGTSRKLNEGTKEDTNVQSIGYICAKIIFGGKHRNTNFYHIFRVGTNFFFLKESIGSAYVQNGPRWKKGQEYRNLGKYCFSDKHTYFVT